MTTEQTIWLRTASEVKSFIAKEEHLKAVTQLVSKGIYQTEISQVKTIFKL